MIVISNEKVPSHFTRTAQLTSYDELLKSIFGDGYDTEDDTYININDLKDTEDATGEEIFEALNESDTIYWFSLDGTAPDFAEPVQDEILDWSQEAADQEMSATNGSKEREQEQIQEEQQRSSEIDSQIRKEAEEQPSAILQDNKGQIKENPKLNTKVKSEFTNLVEQSVIADDTQTKEVQSEEAKVIVFGSSKGGTGKTFTAIISTYRYAKTHPNERVALVDFDLIDGQLGISIHRISPTMRNYYNSYLKDEKDFSVMKEYAVHGNKTFPPNVDFYLAPSNGQVVKNDDFWFNVIDNLVANYDLVVFDTGIDYLNIKPISYAYQSADKINLVTTTSIKSVTSVSKQISKLKGETPNNTYDKEDNLSPRLNVIITQMIESDEMNKTIYDSLSSKANVIATFGVITGSVSQAEFYGEWNVFDENTAINETLDRIMSL